MYIISNNKLIVKLIDKWVDKQIKKLKNRKIPKKKVILS